MLAISQPLSIATKRPMKVLTSRISYSISFHFISYAFKSPSLSVWPMTVSIMAITLIIFSPIKIDAQANKHCKFSRLKKYADGLLPKPNETLYLMLCFLSLLLLLFCWPRNNIWCNECHPKTTNPSLFICSVSRNDGLFAAATSARL